MSPPSALLVTSFQRSLGETYTLSRFAAELREEGWRTPFLASAFAAGFLERQGTPVTLLMEDREANRVAFEASLERWRPSLLISADPYLYWATDARRWWSTDWLLEPGLPVVTFDHLKFHPEPCDIRLAFLDRFRLDPSLASALRQVPAGARPRPTVHVPALGAGFTVLVRPCPAHDPGPADEPRIRPYDMTRGEAADVETGTAADRKAARRRLGIPDRDRLIVLPAGSWAMELARVLRLPYPHLLARLLLHYLSGAPQPVHLVFVGSELEPAHESHGCSSVRMLAGLPFRELRDLLAAADLVLGDNASSATLGRAVMGGVAAGAFAGSVEVRRRGARIDLEAPFPLSPFVADLLGTLERELPGSVFPFAVYPLGWRREMESLFSGNLYATALAWMELFDEEATTRRLIELLFDPAARRSLAERQATYRQRVRALPGAAVLADVALRARVAA